MNTSLALDTYDPALDLDDLVWATFSAFQAEAVAATGSIPFVRVLKRGMAGPDVLAVQRALKVAKVAPEEYEKMRVYGLRTAKAVERFQTANGLKADGEYGKATHAKMLPFFDAWGATLMRRAKKNEVEDGSGLRPKIAEAAWRAYRVRDQVHYFQERPMEWIYWTDHLKVPTRQDCSEFATWAYWAAGAPDPNGFSFSGNGYTGTLCVRGQRIALSQARPGDLVFYGGGAPWGHVAIYVGGGNVLSHGSETGPHYVAAGYRPVGDVRSYLP